MTNSEREYVYKVGDYVKLINPTDEQLQLHRRKGEIGIISYIDSGEIYVTFFYWFILWLLFCNRR